MKQSSNIHVFKRRFRRYLSKRAFYNVCDVQQCSTQYNITALFCLAKINVTRFDLILTVNHTFNYVALSTT